MPNLLKIKLFVFAIWLGTNSYGQSMWYARGGVVLKIDSMAQLFIDGDSKFVDSATVKNLGKATLSGDLTNQTNTDLICLDSGLVVLKGTVNQELSGDLTFYQLEIDNPSTVSYILGSMGISHTLFLSQGIFNSNDSIYLKSTATRTARVAESNGGSTSGDFSVERYISTGSNAWRMIAAPVDGATIAQWEDDFYTSGYSGSQFPTFPFVSVAFYDESIAGEFDAGYVNASSTSNNISAGTGAWAYLGPLPLTFDAKGPLHHGTFDFGVSYSVGGSGANHDGWNLLGNPYASAIDWDAPSGWTKTNVNDAIYLWDGEAGQFRTYVSGVGTNGGTSIIPSSQSFYVQTNAGSPSLTINEAAKSASEAPFVYRNHQRFLRFKLNHGSYQDEAVVRFDQDASTGFDPVFDANKSASQQTYSPSLGTRQGQLEFAINTMPLANEVIIPIVFSANWPALYEFSITEIQNLPTNYCFSLFDNAMNQYFPLSDAFSVLLNLDTGIVYDNYELRATKAFEVEYQIEQCYMDSSASIQVELFNDFEFWTSIYQNGILVFNDSVFDGVSLSDLSSGHYSVVLEHKQCAMNEINLEIEEREKLSSKATVEFDSTNQVANVSLEVKGGVPPYQIYWEQPLAAFGATLNSLVSGDYFYQVLDANSCLLEDSISVPTFLSSEKISRSEKLEVWPNPTSGSLSLTYCNSCEELELLTLQGKRVMTFDALNKTSIDISALKAGVYILQTKGLNTNQRFKIIKTD